MTASVPVKQPRVIRVNVHHESNKNSCGQSQYKDVILPVLTNPIVEIRWSYDHLSPQWDFLCWLDNMFILNPGRAIKQTKLIQTAPMLLDALYALCTDPLI